MRNLYGLTLRELEEFDAHPMQSGNRVRYLCPKCHNGRSHTDSHRCLSVEPLEGLFKCFRCGLGGVLDDFERQRHTEVRRFVSERKKQSAAEKAALWKELMERVEPLPGTPSQEYLALRGVDGKLAKEAGVRHCDNWMGSPAAVFPCRDATGRLIAAQGRYLDSKRDPKTRSLRATSRGVFSTAPLSELASGGSAVALVEAPIDALSYRQLFGVEAIAFFGCNMPPWVASALRGKRRSLLLAADADEAGERACSEWRRMLGDRTKTGRHRPTGGKDWNEVLKASRRI